jgi:hypothetical protein
MFSTFGDIGRTNVDYWTSDTFGGGDDDVVVFSHLEGVQGFLGGFVEDSLIDGLGDRVVDEFTED